MSTRLTTQGIIRIVGVSLVLILAVSLGLRVYARAGEENLEGTFREKLGPLEIPAYASPDVPDADNAAIWLRGAALALQLEEADKELLSETGRAAARDWSSRQRQALERLLARQAPAIELAGRALGKACSSYGLAGVESVLKPKMPLPDLLSLARLLEVDARHALAAGDEAGFVSAVGQIFVLGASLEREAPLTAQLVGIAAERLGSHALAAALSDPHLAAATLVGLRGVGSEVDLVAAWRHTLAAQGAGAYSTSAAEISPSGRVLFGPKARHERLNTMLALADRVVRPLGLDRELVARLEASNKEGEKRSLAETHAACGARYQSILSLRRLARLAIAVRLESLDTGRYPDTLAAWPEASAPDPFTGGSLRYERRTDGSAVIGVPGAEELFNRVNEIRNYVPYTWELPAPVKGVEEAKK